MSGVARNDDERADICIYACTGTFGSSVVRLLCELATENVTVLLAGRNLSKVQALDEELRARRRQDSQKESPSLTKSSLVQIQVYPKAVDIDDSHGLFALARRTRVLANCIKVDANPRAMEWIANACIQADTHYLDLAVSLQDMLPIYSGCQRLPRSADGAAQAASNESSSAKIVPGCALDCAYFDVALAQAERAFASNCRALGMQTATATTPTTTVELVFAMRPGPLGFKWPVESIDTYFESEKKHPGSAASKAKTSTSAVLGRTGTASGASALNQQSTFQPANKNKRTMKRKTPLLCYSSAAHAWTLPWFIAKDAIQFLVHQREPHVKYVDARLALPQIVWRATLCALYGLLVAMVFCPALVLAYKVIRFRWLQQLLLKALPIVSLGLFTNDKDEMTWAMHEIGADLFITTGTTNVQTGQALEFLYVVSTPSIYLHHECIAIASLELLAHDDNTRTKNTNDDDDNNGSSHDKSACISGVLTPAQAPTNTGFWERLQLVGKLQEHSSIQTTIVS